MEGAKEHTAAEKKAKQAAVGAATPADQEISPETAADLATNWLKRHDFAIPDSWLLIPLLQGKLRRGLQLDPIVIEVSLVEPLRPCSCSDRAAGVSLALVVGKAPMVVEQAPADLITRPFEFYNRVRAWFVTMAYVSLR